MSRIFGDEQRLDHIPIRAVVDPVGRRLVGPQEADQRGLVVARPAAPRESRRALIGAERFGRRDHLEAAPDGRSSNGVRSSVASCLPAMRSR